MRNILTATLALALAACASTSPLPPAQASAGSIVVVASLATNKCEEAVTPYQTRAIVGVNQATRAFQKGVLGAVQLREVIAAGQRARSSLAAACEGRKDAPGPEFAQGKQAVDKILATLGSK